MSSNRYTIHEQYLAGKRDDIQCEDLICITDDFIAVLDGVTSKDKKMYNGTTGGHFAAQNVAETIQNLPADIHYREAINQITHNLSEAIRSCYPDSEQQLNPPGTQLGLYSVHRREIWNIGDIHVRVGKENQPLYAPPHRRHRNQFPRSRTARIPQRRKNGRRTTGQRPQLGTHAPAAAPPRPVR